MKARPPAPDRIGVRRPIGHPIVGGRSLSRQVAAVRRAILTLGCAALVACDARATTAPPPPVAAIVLQAPTDVLVAGSGEALTAVLTAPDGSRLPSLPVAWAVGDTAVAAISATGVLTARAAGATVVSATSGGQRAELPVAVAPDAIPLLRVPFAGTFAASNPFDHDLPHEFADSNGFVLDWSGARLLGRLDGHNGYDWPMPVGTPVLAAADAQVLFAGGEAPWSCPLLRGATVSALYVHLRHTAPTGELFATLYVHLSRIDVQTGDSVRAGQQIGLSGNTGCSTGPHLHFGVGRQLYARSGSRKGTVVDPFGWRGNGLDPWLLQPDGAASSRLWIPGQEPDYELTPRFASAPLDASPPLRPLSPSIRP